jgi:dihydropyrimidinase
MAAFDLIVRGGRLVTTTEDRVADIGVTHGRVTAIGETLTGDATREIDASGLLVLPGGVDTHCHVEQRSSTGLMTADDFRSASVSAACGGTTTIVPFAAQHRGESLLEVMTAYAARAEAGAVIDYAFHLILADPHERALREELPALMQQGDRSLKVFMTYEALRISDRQFLDVLSVAREHGGLVMVHAENHDAIAWRTAALLAEGRTAPRYHAECRPPCVEREATHRAIMLAELAGAPLFVVHVSCADALQEIARARQRGLDVRAETCPQYLLLSAEDLDRPGCEGAKFVCSPPLRTSADQDALWDGLQSGVLDLISSDHAPYRYDDPGGKRPLGDETPFTRIANGLPGLETRLPLLMSEGVGHGRLGFEQFVALTSTTPARIFGLYPQKGTIAVGSDADLALWDLTAEVTVAQARLHDNMDYPPYEGRAVRGWPVTTISRGEIIWSDGEVRATPGRGRRVARP